MSIRLVVFIFCSTWLAGCVSPAVVQTEGQPSHNSQLLSERDAVLKQSDIDPLTDFIGKYQQDENAAKLVAGMTQVRQLRCERIRDIYQQRQVNKVNTDRLRHHYSYSCPAMVASFVARWKASQARPEEEDVLMQCQMAMLKNQFLQVIKSCANLAVEGERAAQVLLARSYRYLHQYPKARYWAGRAAEEGSADGKFLLGDLLANGQGVTVNHPQALRWKEQSAKQGHLQAQKDVANYYLMGRGVEKNVAMAKLWLSLAAKKGDRFAQLQLGQLYVAGVLGKKDYARAERWFNQAAGQGSREALYQLGLLYAEPGFAGYDQSRAYVWLRLAGLNGHPQAQRNALKLAEDFAGDQLAQADQMLDALEPNYRGIH